jgi:hypothetical protein
MKKASAVLAVALLCSILVWARSNSDPVTELTSQLNNFLAAASHTPPSAADKAVFNQFFDDDVLYTRAVGAVITKQEIMKSLDEPPSPGDPEATYSAEDVTIHAYGNTAIVAFTLVQKVSDGSVKKFRNTGTFMNRNHGWRAVAWQATPVAAQSAAERK